MSNLLWEDTFIITAVNAEGIKHKNVSRICGSTMSSITVDSLSGTPVTSLTPSKDAGDHRSSADNNVGSNASDGVKDASAASAANASSTQDGASLILDLHNIFRVQLRSHIHIRLRLARPLSCGRSLGRLLPSTMVSAGVVVENKDNASINSGSVSPEVELVMTGKCFRVTTTKPKGTDAASGEVFISFGGLLMLLTFSGDHVDVCERFREGVPVEAHVWRSDASGQCLSSVPIAFQSPFSQAMEPPVPAIFCA